MKIILNSGEEIETPHIVKDGVGCTVNLLNDKGVQRNDFYIPWSSIKYIKYEWLINMPLEEIALNYGSIGLFAAYLMYDRQVLLKSLENSIRENTAVMQGLKSHLKGKWFPKQRL